MIVHVENTMESTQKSPARTNKWISKITKHKINIYKSIAFLYTYRGTVLQLSNCKTKQYLQ